MRRNISLYKLIPQSENGSCLEEAVNMHLSITHLMVSQVHSLIQQYEGKTIPPILLWATFSVTRNCLTNFDVQL